MAVNLFGLLSANLGLGVAARSWLRLLGESGVIVHAVDVADGLGRSGHTGGREAVFASPDEPAPHRVDLFVLNPPELAALERRRPRALDGGRRRRAVVPFWELPRLPAAWIPALSNADALVASSRYLHATLAADLPSVPIAGVPLPVYVESAESASPANRRSFGLPEEATVFVTAFELASGIERKNPWGAVAAFRCAFPDRQDVRLVLKLNNPHAEPWLAEEVGRLRALPATDPRIVVLEETLAHRDVLALWSCADVHVSLHRAETVALGPLEAMALGRPVVATAWSGNLDYMNADNACLVGYDLVPVRVPARSFYHPERVGRDVHWAEPRIGEAAGWLRRLADDPDLRRRIGARAAIDVAARQRGIRPHALLSLLGDVDPPETFA